MISLLLFMKNARSFHYWNEGSGYLIKIYRRLKPVFYFIFFLSKKEYYAKRLKDVTRIIMPPRILGMR